MTAGAGASGRAWVLRPVVRTDEPATRSPEEQIEEAVGLARAIRLEVVGAEAVRLAKPRPGTLLGRGKVDELAAVFEGQAVDVVVIDAALTPVQQRNLERAWNTKVIDRTGLILEIFGERAQTREGRLQVELARLSYQLSRLVRSWTHLERQRGGFGFLGGPGETQLETDRRLIRERIAKLRRELEEVKRTRGLHRQARRRVPYPVVALVGYTNAGKSTLFNRLTGAGVEAADQLFATLDPTMRALRLPSGRKVILSDTVGFISDLPTELVAAFRATLEEVQEAEIILHVRDISRPDTGAQRDDVHRVLKSLGVDASLGERLVEFWNKADLLAPEHRERLVNAGLRGQGVVVGSALTGEGCDDLLALLDARLGIERRTVELRVPHDRGDIISWLYDHGEVIGREDEGEAVRIRARLDPSAVAQLRGDPAAVAEVRFLDEVEERRAAGSDLS